MHKLVAYRSHKFISLNFMAEVLVAKQPLRIQKFFNLLELFRQQKAPSEDHAIVSCYNPSERNALPTGEDPIKIYSVIF
jgi:hypothetical protein